MEDFENYDPEDWCRDEGVVGSDESFFDSSESYMDWYKRDRAQDYRQSRGDRKAS